MKIARIHLSKQNMPSLKKIITFKLPILLVIPLLLIAFFAGFFNTKTTTQASVIKTPINQTQEVDSLKIFVNEAQATQNIKLSQKGVNAPAGKKFLVLFTEVANASSSAQTLNYGDYFRIDEDGKKFAPLAINTNFIIPPQSTLEKQLIFIVEEKTKQFNLLVGPLDKPQKPVQINFP